MSPVSVIAVFDIGKTNKKFFLINEAYEIVLERSVHFDEIKDEDGYPCDDVALLSHWVIETLTGALQIKEFNITAVNFSAYGASFVYIDKHGKTVAPLYSYLKSYDENLKNELYDKYGGAEKISCETASPVLGSLNSGMQLYRIMKAKPLLYEQIKYALHLPQYVSFLITHYPCSDITSIGSHTQLWDYQKNEYHKWVIGEEIDKKLAPVFPSYKTISVKFKSRKLNAGIGLHDSSAALIPYLTVFAEPFVLISTGTWCISLNPFNNTALTNEELKNDCLCFMGYKGNAVKASRLFAGNDHEQQVKRIAAYFNAGNDFYKKIKYNPDAILSLKESYSFDQTPAVGINQSDFSNRKLPDFKNYEEAYHCLMLDIMQQQAVSTQLVIRNSKVNRIFVDGGFSSNSIYMHLLAFSFPNIEIFAASVAQATAMGAALAIHEEWNPLPLPADMVKLKYYKLMDKINNTK